MSTQYWSHKVHPRAAYFLKLLGSLNPIKIAQAVIGLWLVPILIAAVVGGVLLAELIYYHPDLLTAVIAQN